MKAKMTMQTTIAGSKDRRQMNGKDGKPIALDLGEAVYWGQRILNINENIKGGDDLEVLITHHSAKGGTQPPG